MTVEKAGGEVTLLRGRCGRGAGIAEAFIFWGFEFAFVYSREE
jgi:hypothetical protein